MTSSCLPPEEETLPRRGTRGVIFSRRRWPICSMSSIRTPEWPRIREFMRIKMAPLTHDSGIVVLLRGSMSGSESPSSVEITPECWCCNKALPRRNGSSVLVSAVKDAIESVVCGRGVIRGGTHTHHCHRNQCSHHIRFFPRSSWRR